MGRARRETGRRSVLRGRGWGLLLRHGMRLLLLLLGVVMTAELLLLGIVMNLLGLLLLGNLLRDLRDRLRGGGLGRCRRRGTSLGLQAREESRGQGLRGRSSLRRIMIQRGLRGVEVVGDEPSQGARAALLLLGRRRRGHKARGGGGGSGHDRRAYALLVLRQGSSSSSSLRREDGRRRRRVLVQILGLDNTPTGSGHDLLLLLLMMLLLLLMLLFDQELLHVGGRGIQMMGVEIGLVRRHDILRDYNFLLFECLLRNIKRCFT